MKQKDYILIVVMVFIGAIVALVLSRVIFSSPKNSKQTAEIVDVITPDFPQPSKKYFNENSVNPAEHHNEQTEETEQSEQDSAKP